MRLKSYARLLDFLRQYHKLYFVIVESLKFKGWMCVLRGDCFVFMKILCFFFTLNRLLAISDEYM